MLQVNEAQRAFLSTHRVAHLATATLEGEPHVVPVCFAFDGEALFVVIDTKPKRVSPLQLKRLLNIQQNPRVAVLLDTYSEDWTRLGYLLIHGRAEIVNDGKEREKGLRLLREKYVQYRTMPLQTRPVLKIHAERLVSWGSVG